MCHIQNSLHCRTRYILCSERHISRSLRDVYKDLIELDRLQGVFSRYLLSAAGLSGIFGSFQQPIL